jgi:hypothetical protein
MAIIACPECGQNVSSTAEACPGCGHPVAKERRSRAVGIGCGGVLLVLFILYAIGSNTQTSAPTQTGRPATSDPKPAAAAIGETYQTTSATAACRRPDQLEKLIGFAAAKDNDAYQNYWMERLVRGDCRVFDKGQKLFLQEASIFGNPCVRARGEIECMYAPRSHLEHIQD